MRPVQNRSNAIAGGITKTRKSKRKKAKKGKSPCGKIFAQKLREAKREFEKAFPENANIVDKIDLE